jgi:osmotically-inducible protein OsmY
MGKRLGGILIGVTLCFAPLTLGCNNSDRDHLARAAGKAREKVKGLTGETGQSLTTGWQSMALDARVSARIKWDKSLNKELIRVQANGAVIELHGTVKDLAQHRRAVELAESTVGIEQVVDLLEEPTQGQ